LTLPHALRDLGLYPGLMSNPAVGIQRYLVQVGRIFAA
jgi:hypothetical protein